MPPDDESAARAFIDDVDPAWICHLAMGSERWAALIAAHCADQSIGYVFTSTAMVFDCEPDGPHSVDDERTAKDEYGRYKIRCEDAINGATDGAIIARFGWQIGAGRGGNNMIERLWTMMEEDNVIRPSRRWIPATSFMTDTCDGLWQLMQRNEPGTYQLDSNAACALPFADIVARLGAELGATWAIEPNDDYVHDQRLVDARIALPGLDERI